MEDNKLLQEINSILKYRFVLDVRNEAVIHTPELAAQDLYSLMHDVMWQFGEWYSHDIIFRDKIGAIDYFMTHIYKH